MSSEYQGPATIAYPPPPPTVVYIQGQQNRLGAVPQHIEW